MLIATLFYSKFEIIQLQREVLAAKPNMCRICYFVSAEGIDPAIT